MIRFFARHPTAGNLLMLSFVAIGCFVLTGVRRESMPDTTPAEFEIRVGYPGASASEIEEAICRRLEDAVDGVRHLKEVRSEAREGVGIVVVEMRETGNPVVFRSDVENEVDGIADFPDDAGRPVITQRGRKSSVLAILVSGPLTAPDLRAYCEDLKDRLKAQAGVSLVDVEGFSDHQLRVELRAEALMRFGLTVQDVARVIGAQSVDLPAGGIETASGDFVLRFTERRRGVGELEDLVIVSGASGAEIRLGELGRVVDTFEVAEDKIEFKGRRAGKLKVNKNKTEDSLQIADAVKAFVADERVRQPRLDFAVTGDTSEALRNQIDLVVTNGWQGMILVFLTMWLFFSLRLSIWVVVGLPVSFLGAAIFMPSFDLTINFMTLIGYLLAIGLLMDDSIVIAENISTHKKRGKSGLQAAIDGVKEVRVGVLSSFLTTTFILGPLCLIKGDAGKQLKVVPMIIILVMSVSLIEAFCVFPGHLGHAVDKDSKPSGRFRRSWDRLFDWIRETLVGGAVDRFVQWRYLFVGCVVAALIVASATLVSGRLPFQAMPDLEGDVIVARVLLPQGTPLARTEAVVAQVMRGLERMDGHFTPLQEDDLRLVRNTFVEYGKNTDAFETGPHVATVHVDLLTAEKRKGRIDEYLVRWRREIGVVPDVVNLVIGEPNVGSTGKAIEVRVQGEDLDDLKKAADEVSAWFSEFTGVSNVLDDMRPGKYEVRMKIRDGSHTLGLDAQAVAQQLGAAFRGQIADEVQVGREFYEVEVRHRDADQDASADLSYFHVMTSNGRQVPLADVVTTEVGRGRARIARVDGVRTVTVRGDIDSAVANTEQIFAVFESDFIPGFEERYPALRLDLEGETKQSATTGASMVTSLVIGLVGVFILLAFQFRNYVEPLIVMVAIPLSLVGVVAGHFLTSFPFTLPSLLGLVSLSGIVVNDSILLVEFIKLARRGGASAIEAATRASRQRFRAVFLTSATTIAGLLPLLAERSLQAQVIRPIAISIAFGLLASTILVLFVIPCFYVILDDFGLTRDVRKDDETADA